jgi:glycosyltransferase involved in cell wall biosynthesis
MKLLVLTNNPNRASFRQRIEVYLDTLRTNGIDCEVAKLPSGYLTRRKLFKRAADFNSVFLQKKCLNFRDAIWLHKYSKKIIYDFDDAIMYSPKTPENDKSSHFRLFRRTAKIADMVIAGNSYLAEHSQKFNRNVKILPTGLHTNAYKVETESKNDGKIRLVWIGSKSTLLYLEQIKPALEEIGLSFNNVVLRIICDDFFDLQNMEVEKCRWSLEKQAVDLVTSDIGLAPLPNNRFTRGKCGFKILQYQAANLPIVTSPVGVNTEYVRNGVTGYHAPNIPQWIHRVSELIDNIELRKQMADAGRKQVQEFDADVIGKKLCEIITKFIKGASGTAEKVETIDVHSPAPSTTGRPKVSVCIPTHNRKDYLKETLDSILAQTYKDYEIVIVDDGSTDGTADMIKQLNFPVTYYWQQNSGDAAARNKLIELARGQYISFIDSDDLLLPDAIERMVKVTEAQSKDAIVYGSYFRIDENGKVYGRCKRKLRSGNITKYLFQTILVHSCGSMFPKKILKAPTAFDTSLRICSDYDLWLRLSLEYPFIALPKPTFKRRRHTANLSTPSFENCFTELLVLKDFYYKKGGNKAVPEKTAIKVFSKEECRAGRCAIREGLHDKACQSLKQSFKQHPNLKSMIYWIRAIIAKKLASF